jgi:hypothetical protein
MEHQILYHISKLIIKITIAAAIGTKSWKKFRVLILFKYLERLPAAAMIKIKVV